MQWDCQSSGCTVTTPDEQNTLGNSGCPWSEVLTEVMLGSHFGTAEIWSLLVAEVVSWCSWIAPLDTRAQDNQLTSYLMLGLGEENSWIQWVKCCLQFTSHWPNGIFHVLFASYFSQLFLSKGNCFNSRRCLNKATFWTAVATACCSLIKALFILKWRLSWPST